MTTICLIRHGETDWNCQRRLQGREDIELNENGRLQAVGCIEYLSQSNWGFMATSPLKRAKETAKIIANGLGIDEVHEIEAFIERDYGSAAGLFPEERKLKFPDGIIYDQEDREILTNRVIAGINATAKRFTNKNIIIVSHGGVINAILAALSQGEIGSGKTRLKNACVNILKFNGEKWNIELYNHSPYEEQKKSAAYFKLGEY